MIRAAQERAIRKRYKEVAPVLDEQGRRRFAAAEALALGRGGVSLMARITGLARPTIYRGIFDIRNKSSAGPGRTRKVGGGRKAKEVQNPTLLTDLKRLVQPVTRGGRVEERRGCLGHAATLRFLSPLIEPDMQISSIRLSDKTSRLRPRLVVAKPAQTYESEIHAPSHTDVRLVMTSHDVIHSLFLPALRLKQDVLPGRYTYLWFNADRDGTYSLMCTQFCGTDHARMIGKFI